nr:phospholipase-like protein [Tanacetum cinerariifolium]
MFEKSDYEELFGPMSNPNVAFISSPEEMSQACFKDSVEFIKGLDDQDGTFFQDDPSREKCMEQHNGICGDTEDGTFDDRVVGKICPKMHRMSVDDGDGVLDSQSDDGDGVLDSQTKDVIKEAAMLLTTSSNSPEVGNAVVSKFFAKFDALKKEEKPNFSSHHNDSSNHIGRASSEAKYASSSSAHPVNEEDVSHLDDNMEIDGQNAKDGYSNSQHHLHLLIKALGTKIENPSIDSGVVVPLEVDNPMLRIIKPEDNFDEADVDSYDDDYMSLFNDEKKPAKSSLNNFGFQQEPNIVDVKDGILEQKANANKGKTIVIQETFWVTVEERPSLGRGLGTLKFKKKNCERALRPNYVLRSAKIRKNEMAMSLKSPFGQQSDTAHVPTKRKTRLKKTEDIVLPFDLEDISGQPRIQSMNHIMTYDPFVVNLSRPEGCKSDKVTVPEYMSAFINNKDLPGNSQHHLHLLIKALGTKIENPSIDSGVVVPLEVDNPMLRIIKPEDNFDEADVDSYDDDYMSAKIRKNEMAMSLKSPFGQQSDTAHVPTKRKTRLKKTEDIVLPFDLEDISGQPRIQSMNHIMTHDPFVVNLSRPEGCKSDKVTVPEYMSAFINNKDLPGLNDCKPHFSTCILNGMMPDYFSNGQMYPLTWIAIEKVYFPVNELKEHWCLAQLEIRIEVVTFYDSLGWAGGSRRR